MHQSRKLAYPQGYREFESLPVRFFEPPSGIDGGFLVGAVVHLQGFVDVDRIVGEVAERLKAHAWKACMRESVSRVRIPLSPL